MNSSFGTIAARRRMPDRKSTRLNSSHLGISYAVFCLEKKSTRLLQSLRHLVCRLLLGKEENTYSRVTACVCVKQRLPPSIFPFSLQFFFFFFFKETGAPRNFPFSPPRPFSV